METLKLFSQHGRVRDFKGLTPLLVREGRIHFDILCEKYPNAGFVEMRLSEDGSIYAAVEDKDIGRTPWSQNQA